ncbi:MAG: VWA domain-containing protein, partial [Verrucomicrobia bacterium]|nr:VWA domain-containing protein [Verrucomicrobiota bacterium]
PRVLIVSSQPEQDRPLAEALRESKLEVKVVDERGLAPTLAEIQSYDAIVLGNVAAGDLGRDGMSLLESAVRDFGVGLVAIGGDQAFAAGGYRNTPLEATLPLDMELSSKKVLPKGALGLVMHGMEFANGNEVARDIALAALDALGPQDEMGVWLWDGTERALFELQAVGNKNRLAGLIAGMNQGDLPSFQGLMSMAYQDLKKSTANLKHLIVFSDGDPNAPTDALMKDLVAARVTISTVMIGGHVQPTTMERMAAQGGGRFYDVKSAAMLPQIFIKETAVILKSAIFEDPFQPQVAAGSELTRGIGSSEFPMLRGYVATSPKPRAETPLLTDKGDPLLAHWQYGLGRAVAFTSDARPKWAQDWIGWGKYRQFWSQAVGWALRRVDNADFNTEVTVENGEGVISVEALDAEGNFRNFLTLQAA